MQDADAHVEIFELTSGQRNGHPPTPRHGHRDTPPPSTNLSPTLPSFPPPKPYLVLRGYPVLL
jgi:hypothetical protein